MESKKGQGVFSNMSWLDSPSLRPFYSPDWITKTKCTANIKGRYNESIDGCGIYCTDDRKDRATREQSYKCRQCGALFREGKNRTYPIRKNKAPLPCEEFELVDRYTKMNEN